TNPWTRQVCWCVSSWSAVLLLARARRRWGAITCGMRWPRSAWSHRQHRIRIAGTPRSCCTRPRGLYIVSDRSRPEEGVEGQPPEDFVYPAIVPNTELLLELAPCQPCDAFLDLCSGTAIAALVAAKSGARQAWAFDITGRSTHFAEFNRRLNGIANMTPATGDLYEPAGDLTFDRIVAHPPYVPVYRPQLIFDSGGHDGEQIVRRIIEGLPRYLRPGGRFYA